MVRGSLKPIFCFVASAGLGALFSGILASIATAAKVRRLEESLKTSLRRDLEICNQDLERTKKDFEIQSEKALRLQADHLAKVVQSRYAVRCRETNILAEIIDLDGTMKFTTQRLGLKTTPGLVLRFLDHFVSSTAPNAAKDDSTLSEARLSDGVQMESQVESTDGKVRVRFNFPEGATHSEQGADYGYSVTMKKAVVMTKEAATVAYGDQPVSQECFYHDTEIPTDLLRIKVIFPPQYSITPSAKVFLAGGWTLHQAATDELQLKSEPNSACLQVTKPLPGFRYLIQWESPESKHVEKLRGISG
jgi:hypothetical protein